MLRKKVKRSTDEKESENVGKQEETIMKKKKKKRYERSKVDQGVNVVSVSGRFGRNGSDYNYVKAVEEVTSGPSEIVSRKDKKTLEKCPLCACQCQSFVYLSHIFSLVWHKAAMDECSIKIELFRNIHCSTVI